MEPEEYCSIRHNEIMLWGNVPTATIKVPVWSPQAMTSIPCSYHDAHTDIADSMLNSHTSECIMKRAILCK